MRPTASCDTRERPAADRPLRYAGGGRGRIGVIPHGIDHERFRPDGPPSPRTDALDLPLRFVLYPANLWPHKNHGALIEALARTHSDVTLVLTGHRYGRADEFADLARRARVGDRVRDLGLVPGD